MTRDKLLDNNTTLFIFYFYSNDDPRDPVNRRQNRFLERRFSERQFSEQTSYNRLNGKAWLTTVAQLSANIPTIVSVDLINRGQESRHIRMKDRSGKNNIYVRRRFEFRINGDEFTLSCFSKISLILYHHFS